MTASRRVFLKGAGALIVGLSSDFQAFAQERQFGTHRSHVDPDKLDSWIAVNSDGTVTAFTGKCDLGQGIFTAQTQLIAEELCVSLQAVKLVQCDTDVTPDQGSTSGSQSTPTNFNVQDLALAAATAREALIGMAAQQFGEDVSRLTAIDGSGEICQRKTDLICQAHRRKEVQPARKQTGETPLPGRVDNFRQTCCRTRSCPTDDGELRVCSECPHRGNAPRPGCAASRNGGQAALSG